MSTPLEDRNAYLTPRSRCVDGSCMHVNAVLADELLKCDLVDVGSVFELNSSPE